MTESVGRRVCAILEEVALSDRPEMSHPFCDIQWRRWLRFLVVYLWRVGTRSSAHVAMPSLNRDEAELCN